MNRQEIIQNLEPILTKAVNDIGVEIVDMEFQKEQGRLIFRIFVDTKDGVTHETCRLVNDIVEPIMDQEDLIKEPYYLEISSPGLERVIKKESDFERFKGNRVKVRSRDPVAGQKHFTGILKGLENNEIVLELEDKTVRIPRSDTVKVRLVAEW
jgi:ribosome maturation factor RimP